MADPIVLSRVMQGELPFTLNLPEGIYQLEVDGSKYSFQLLQERIAVPVGADSIMVGLVDYLKAQFGDKWESQFKIDLRTIVRKAEDVELSLTDLKEPDELQLIEAAKTKILLSLRNDTSNRPSSPEKLESEAKEQLDKLNIDDRKKFAFDTAVRLAARQLFRNRDIETFCRATNILIRLYMAKFNDFFVQEITENYFSGTAFHGVLVETFLMGNLLIIPDMRAVFSRT